MLARNKKTVTLNLSKPEGAELLQRLVSDADVLIENFRPGTLERWGLSPDELHAGNPGLVIARITGFGQFGPYSTRPGFGTLAESMSGFAAITGEPDGPPTLPPFGLADGISALAGMSAVMSALYHRDARGGSGQVIDLAIIEPILTLLGPQPIVYDQLKQVQPRQGNRSSNNAPRNVYLTADERWVAISTSAGKIAERVMHLVGHPEVIDEPWFDTGRGRAEHADLLDDYVGSWIARRDLDEVIEAFEKADAAVAPIYDITQIMVDPQYVALDSITTVEDEELGPLRMQNIPFRFDKTPGSIRWAGRPIGADNEEVLSTLGVSADELVRLAEEGVIA
jgi:crotonobetainyl-CoA:carnitine CoA-transferase CaiB-like acyl-CoA transferase